MTINPALTAIRQSPGALNRVQRLVQPYLKCRTLEIAEEEFGDLLDESRMSMPDDPLEFIEMIEQAYMTILKEEWEKVNG